MKKGVTLLAIMLSAMFLLSVQADASPFLVCNPYASGDGQPIYFKIQFYQDTDRTIFLGDAITSAAYPVENGEIILHHDLAGIAYGTYYLDVKAAIFDAWEGEVTSAAAPFSFTRRDMGPIIQNGIMAPSGLRLSNQ